MQNYPNDATTSETSSSEQDVQRIPDQQSPTSIDQTSASESPAESLAPLDVSPVAVSNEPSIATLTSQPMGENLTPQTDTANEQPMPPSANEAAVGQHPNTPSSVNGVVAGQYSGTPQAGYLPPTFPTTVLSTSQPGYLPQTPQPGYIPPTSFPPGYVPLPGSFQSTPAPKKPNGMAIVSVSLAVLLLLAVILTGVLHNANITGTQPTTQGTQSNPGTQTTQGTAPNATPTAALGQPTSAFQAASCPFPVGAGLTEGQQVSCGYVTVPENRESSTSGKVKLAVAIFRAPQYMTTPDPAPVLRLDGGPGGPSLATFAESVNAANYSSLVFDHDQIMFDQRGTGYSTPSLQCKELIQLQYSTSDVSEQNYLQQAQACHDRLVSQGIDLNGFNTLQNAADVSDLVHALGYQKMTIYGVSYGTRLALTVMRLYPGVVRDAVLDSVYPPNHNRDDIPSDAQRVFNVFFQGCAKDPNCNAKYPNLQSVFYNLVDTLNAHPASFPATDATTGQAYTLPLSGGDLVSWLFSTFYVTQFIPMLPQTIFQIKAHDYHQLSFMEGFLAFDDTISDGFFYSVECGEDWPFLTQQDITKSLQGITPQIAAVFGPGEQQEFDVCQFWKVQKVPAAQKQPVVSNLPTLVLSGEYDPITPPSNGQETANNLSNSYFFIFPGQGHGQEYSSDCSDTIINAFEDDPSQKPAGSCIAQMAEPAFQ